MCRVSGFYINSVFGFTQSQTKIFKSNAKLFKCIANDMQVHCKRYAKWCQAKQRKEKQSKEKQIKQKQTKIVLKFVCKF